ncbi:MAG: hypothetical protein ACXVPE_03380 [Bacteroidia bacterium]
MFLLNRLLLAGIIISTLIIFFQDLKDKEISIWVLCLFSISVAGDFLVNTTFSGSGILISLSWCLIWYLLVTLYFSIKYRRFVKIQAALLQWGDIWVILSLAFAFYWVNYIFFLTLSIVISSVFYILARVFFKNASKKIPLAGILCFLFVLVKIIFFACNISTFNEELVSTIILKIN